MDELSAIRLFVRVAEAGSFSEVARQTDLSTSSVTRQINHLEASLGVRLIKRSTRHLALTEAGHHYLSQISPLLNELELIKRSAASHDQTIRGVIRVHARNSAGSEILVPALPQFLERYPDVSVDLTLTDERRDLLAEGVDLGIWLGKLQDSNYVARSLSSSSRLVCGSPEYFQRRGIPTVPDDLLAHNCLVYKSVHYSNEWRFRKGQQSTVVAVSGNLTTSNSSVLIASAKNGLGLVVLQDWMVRNSIREGSLNAVLTDYEVSPTGDDAQLFLVYPHKEGVSRKVRVFIDFVVALFKKT